MHTSGLISFLAWRYLLLQRWVYLFQPPAPSNHTFADVLLHYSTCALIQRAVSPDNVTFNQDCLDSSRKALLAHQRCSEQFNVKGNEDLWSGYIHWYIRSLFHPPSNKH
jgi:hypothetical protein